MTMVSPGFCLPKLGRPFTSFGHKANYASSKNTQCRHSETFRLIVVLGLNLVVSLMYFALFGYGIHNMLSHRHEAGLIYCEQNLSTNSVPFHELTNIFVLL